MMFRVTGLIQVSQEQIVCCLSFFIIGVVVVSEDYTVRALRQMANDPLLHEQIESTHTPDR